MKGYSHNRAYIPQCNESYENSCCLREDASRAKCSDLPTVKPIEVASSSFLHDDSCLQGKTINLAAFYITSLEAAAAAERAKRDHHYVTVDVSR